MLNYIYVYTDIMDEGKKCYQIELLKKIKNNRNILFLNMGLTEKIIGIFKKNCLAFNTRNIKSITMLVEFTIYVEYTLDNIIIAFSNCIEQTDFDTVYKFYRLMSCWEGKR